MSADRPQAANRAAFAPAAGWRQSSAAKRLSVFCGIGGVGVGVAVLVGWVTDSTLLKQLSPNLASIKPNAAISYLLIGAALVTRGVFAGRPSKFVWRLLALASSVIGTLTLVEYASDTSFGIDELLFSDTDATASNPFPGRMASLTALNVTFLGCAVGLLGVERRPWRLLCQSIAVWVLVTAAGIIVGYSYGAGSLYELRPLSTLALHAAITQAVLAVGVVAADEGGISALISSRGAGGVMLRQLLPFAVLAPLVLGWVRLQLGHADVLNLENGVALLTTSVVVVSVVALAVSALSLNRTDSRRRAAEDELREANVTLEERVATRTAELERYSRELEASNAELDSFSYSVSHDLRAPLRAIDGFGRILAEDHFAELSAEAQRYLGRMRSNAQHMGSLVDDLLALARLNRAPVVTSLIDMNDLVAEVLDTLLGAPSDSRPEVTVEVLPPCQADRPLLRQLVQNLLDNAIKFSRNASPPIVRVGSGTDALGAFYFVRDNGVGFDPKYASKLFGIFQRLHGPDEYEGTGVGLAIVHRIVTRQGGRVWFESEPGKGATFFFDPGSAKGEAS